MSIPKTFQEAIKALLEMPDAVEVIKAHYSNNPKNIDDLQNFTLLGRWIRNNWNLWLGCNGCPVKEAELYYWFYRREIWHPDDISMVIPESTYCNLNGASFNLDNSREFFKEFWENSWRVRATAITKAVERVVARY